MRVGARRLGYLLVMGVLVSFASPVLALDFGAADLTVDLEGETRRHRLPISAFVEIAVEGPDAALVRMTNTSPVAEGAVVPRLRRIVFNLAGHPARGCFTLETDDALRLVGGRPWWGAWGPGPRGRFDLGVKAQGSRGLDAGESAVFRLRVKERCLDMFAFSADSFLDAQPSTWAGQDAQWLAHFRAGGPCRGDRGYAGGNGEALPPPPTTPDFTWAEFMALSAEIEGVPSVYGPDDPRGGSYQVFFNGGWGFDGVFTDPAFLAGGSGLMNGASVTVEQSHFNRTWPPDELDENGCTIGFDFPQCWLWPDEGDTELVSALPTWSEGSNQDFDTSGVRVAVSGEAVVGLGDTPPEDSGHEVVRISWTDPEGLDTARYYLRARFDLNLDGSLDEPFAGLLSARWDGPDFMEDIVQVVEETPTRLTVEINVQAALAWYATLP